MSQKVIKICHPKVENVDGRCRLAADVIIGGEVHSVWYEVEERYGKYLCWERSDAYLIGILNYAMRHHYDIECEAPVTAQLLYQIKTYLIPAIARNSKVMYPTQIVAKTADEFLENAGCVGTGVSCGVDSMHAIMQYTNPEWKQLKLTHLVLNNVGSFWTGKEDRQYEWHRKHVTSFCEKYGYELIISNSNIADEIRQVHFLSHTYTDVFSVYALQKLWRTYFYASAGEEFGEYFRLKDNENIASAQYDLLSLDVFSTRLLKIYSEGGAIERIDKVKKIIEFEPSYKYLHVCVVDKGPNCGTCGKCLRTLTTLDALGVLERYSEAFDIESYKRNRKKHLRWLFAQQIFKDGDLMTRPAYEVLRNQISCWDKCRVIVGVPFWKFYFRLSQIKWLRRIVRLVKFKKDWKN